MKKIFCLLFVLPLLLSCVDLNEIPDAIVGKYLDEKGGSVVEFKKEGTYSWTSSSGQVLTKGTFTVLSIEITPDEREKERYQIELKSDGNSTEEGQLFTTGKRYITLGGMADYLNGSHLFRGGLSGLGINETFFWLKEK